GNGINVFIGNGQLHYQFAKCDKEAPANRFDKNILSKLRNNKKKIDAYRLDMSLVGANRKAEVITEDEQQYYENYFLADNKSVKAYTYQKITYKNVYHDIDWVLYIKDAQLEYDFIVRPGGNVKDIKLKYRGATQLSKQDGTICINTPMGKVSERSLFSYDLQTGKEVTSRFILRNNVISFDVSHRGNTIVIDPKLLWGTYYGGSGDDNFDAGGMYPLGNVWAAGSVACDSKNNVYIYGLTGSNNLATTGSFKTTLGGYQAAFLVKFNSSGVRLWATYYCDSGINFPNGIACDNSGNLYIAGSTNNHDSIATTGSYLDTLIDSSSRYKYTIYLDAYLVKFDSFGARQWGTYYGDTSGITTGIGVVCDPAGNVYLTGNTSAYKKMGTIGTHKDTLSGESDCFIAKFDQFGNRKWGTYYGGNGTEQPTSIAYDNHGHIYLSGLTTSDNGIATPGSYEPIDTPTENIEPGFIAKFDTSGKLNWGTYFGLVVIYPNSVTCDLSGNLYVASNNGNGKYIRTGVSFQRSDVGYPDAFLSKFDSSGNLKWSTYYGESDSFYTFGSITGVTCDTSGNVIFCGYTHNEKNIASAGNIQPQMIGYVDGFVAKFTSNGERIWGTYYGGNQTLPTGITCDLNNNIYVTGATESDTLVVTAGAFQTVKDTTILFGPTLDIPNPYVNFDAFLAKIANDTDVYIVQPFNDTTICRGTTFNLLFGTNYNFQSDNTFTAQLSDDTGSFNSPTIIGSIKAIGTTGTISCTIPDSIPVGGGYRIRIVASDPESISSDNSVDIHIDTSLSPFSIVSNSPVCSGDSLKVYASSAVTYSWTGPDSFKSTFSNIIVDSVSPKYAGTYYVTATALGCPSVSDSITIGIMPNAAKPTIKPIPTLCNGDSLVLSISDSSSGVAYLWTGPDNLHTSRPDTTIDSPKGGFYIWKVSLGGCYVKDSFLVGNPGYRPTKPDITSNSPICYSDTLHLSAFDTTWPVSYLWLLPDSTTYTNDSLNIYHAKSGEYKVLATWAGGCSSEDSVRVIVDSNVVPSVSIKESNSWFIAGVADTFTAYVVNGGISPNYRWYVNNKIASGAVGRSFITKTLKQGDVVSVEIHSSAKCAIPDTATSKTWPLGIVSVTANNSKFILYPNPNDGSFTVDGNANLTATNAIVEVINLAGVTVYKEVVLVNNGVIHKSINLSSAIPSGLYFIRIKTDEQTTVLRFAIER
ncbi:MAG TPA: SBBP repeat-containing protein, partial [Flavipsychrobacter sp.]|nr:SBBP repeat-containing protein [Flavipsychrobacter sp.]